MCWFFIVALRATVKGYLLAQVVGLERVEALALVQG
jgi:hypothetical protein